MKTIPDPTSGLDVSTRILRAFADPVRLRLLNLLAEHREICVCHLRDALELPQPTVSRHLATLRQVGLVSGRKQGLWVHYRLARSKSALARILLGCLGHCLGDSDVFQRDLDRLSGAANRCDDRSVLSHTGNDPIRFTECLSPESHDVTILEAARLGSRDAADCGGSRAGES
jgi:ArsR family transcriptional regulator